MTKYLQPKRLLPPLSRTPQATSFQLLPGSGRSILFVFHSKSKMILVAGIKMVYRSCTWQQEQTNLSYETAKRRHKKFHLSCQHL